MGKMIISIALAFILVIGISAGTAEQWLASLVGKDGTDGANGKAAYALAVVKGYIKTEAEWLASLHGTDGTKERMVKTENRNIIYAKSNPAATFHGSRRMFFVILFVICWLPSCASVQ